jgi:hypothetical protein
MEALEDMKNAFVVLRRDADAVVLQRQAHRALLFLHSDDNAWRAGGELDGTRQEIAEHLDEHGAVGADHLIGPSIETSARRSAISRRTL